MTMILKRRRGGGDKFFILFWNPSILKKKTSRKWFGRASLRQLKNLPLIIFIMRSMRKALNKYQQSVNSQLLDIYLMK